MSRDFAADVAEARERYAAVIAAARRPDASRDDIEAALDLAVSRRWARRALELVALPLSRAERQAALSAFGDQLRRERVADLALFDEDGQHGE